MPLPTRLLVHTLTITRPAETADGQGGFATTYPTVGTTPARVWPVSAREQESAGKRDGVLTHKAVLPAATDVRRHDVLVDGDDAWTVLAVQDPSLRVHHRTALLERLQETT